MHDHNFYHSVDMGEKTLRDLIDKLRRGTELGSGITGTQYKHLQHRVEERIDHHTKECVKDCFLEYEINGMPKKTKLFKQYWDKRHEYWNENIYDVPDSPTIARENRKKRRRRMGQGQQPKSPIAFPNVFPGDRHTPCVKPALIARPAREVTPEQDTVDQISRSRLTLMAASALGVEVTNQQENKEGVEVHDAMIQEFTNVRSEPIVTDNTIDTLASPTMLEDMEVDASNREQSKSQPKDAIEVNSSHMDLAVPSIVTLDGPIATTPKDIHRSQLENTPFSTLIIQEPAIGHQSGSEPKTAPNPGFRAPSEASSAISLGSRSIPLLPPHDTRAQYEKDTEDFLRCRVAAENPQPPQEAHPGTPLEAQLLSREVSSPQSQSSLVIPLSPTTTQQSQPSITDHYVPANASCVVVSAAHNSLSHDSQEFRRSQQINTSNGPREIVDTTNLPAPSANHLIPSLLNLSPINSPRMIRPTATVQKEQIPGYPSGHSPPAQQRNREDYWQNPNFRSPIQEDAGSFGTTPRQPPFQSVHNVQAISPGAERYGNSHDNPLEQPERHYGSLPTPMAPSSSPQLQHQIQWSMSRPSPGYQDHFSPNQSVPESYQMTSSQYQLSQQEKVQKTNPSIPKPPLHRSSTSSIQPVRPQYDSSPAFTLIEPNQGQHFSIIQIDPRSQHAEAPSSTHRPAEPTFAPKNVLLTSHSLQTSPRIETLPSPPQSSPRVLKEISPIGEEGILRSTAQDLPPAKDPATPSRTPSPVHLPAPDRRPYVYRPDPTQWSPEKDNPPGNQVKQKLHPAIMLSNNTTLTTYSEAGPEEPRQKLELIVQKVDKTLDLDNPLPSKALKDSSLAKFFEVYASHSGMPLSSLTALTFIASFGNNQEFVVRRYMGEKAWEKFKKRLRNLLQLEQKENPDETEFEVWVKFADLSKARTGGNELL